MKKSKIVVTTMLGAGLVAGVTVPQVALGASRSAASTGATGCASVSSSSPYYHQFVQNPKFQVGSSSWIPQGMGLWKDFDGGRDAYVVSMYQKGTSTTRIVAYWAEGPKLKQAIGYASLKAGSADLAHGSGVAITPQWFLLGAGGVGGNGGDITPYSKSAVKKQILAKGSTLVKGAHKPSHVSPGASFMDYDAGASNLLWAGNNTSSPSVKGHMYGYKVNANGSVTRATGSVTVPPQTQGVVVTKNHFVFASSWGTKQSSIYVRNRATKKQAVLKAPCRAEGMTQRGDRLYLVYESGASYYGGHREGKVVHSASLAGLSKLVR